MRQRAFYVFLIIAVFIILTGMGGSGGIERAPRVEKNFAVTIVDGSGIKIEGEKFSWEGRINIQGYLGMAQVTMPFDKVRELTVGERVERKVKVIVHLVDGTETRFDVDAKSRCFGESSFGSFMLLMEDIKTITFKKS